MSSTTHTPMPWTPYEDCSRRIRGRQYAIATVYGALDDGLADANFRLIVAAVNSYMKLAARLGCDAVTLAEGDALRILYDGYEKPPLELEPFLIHKEHDHA